MNTDVVRVRDALAELVKAALLSDDARSLACREAGGARLKVLADDPPDADHVRIDGAWTLAVQEAETPELIPYEGRVNLTLPRQCPFTLDELLDPGFDLDGAVERIRQSASTG